MPDRQIIKESLALRAKYRTKRQAPRQIVKCFQIAPHPKNRGGEPIRATRTRTKAIYILESGYDPAKAIVNSVAVEVGNPAATFSDHFKANAGLDPDHYFDPGLSILFAGLSHNHKNLAERNIWKACPGCV